MIPIDAPTLGAYNDPFWYRKALNEEREVTVKTQAFETIFDCIDSEDSRKHSRGKLRGL